MQTDSPHTPIFTFRGISASLGGLIVGFLVGSVLGFGLVGIFPALIVSATGYAAVGTHVASTLRRALFYGLVFFTLATVTSYSAGMSWLAGILIAIIAFFTSVCTTAGALPATLALLISPVYLSFAGFSLVMIRDQNTQPLMILIASGVGVLVALVFSGIASAVLSRITPDGRDTETVSIQWMWKAVRQSIADFGRAPKDGIRRSVALGIGMVIFQLSPAHDVFLLLMTIGIVLPVYGRVPLIIVGSRLLGAFIAVGIALLLPFVAPPTVIAIVAFVALAYAIATALHSTTHTLAAVCLAYLLFIGAPGAEIGIYAGWRLIDAAGGFLIALICGYAIWRKQPLLVTPIPVNLHAIAVHQDPRVRPA